MRTLDAPEGRGAQGNPEPQAKRGKRRGGARTRRDAQAPTEPATPQSKAKLRVKAKSGKSRNGAQTSLDAHMAGEPVPAQPKAKPGHKAGCGKDEAVPRVSLMPSGWMRPPRPQKSNLRGARTRRDAQAPTEPTKKRRGGARARTDAQLALEPATPQSISGAPLPSDAQEACEPGIRRNHAHEDLDVQTTNELVAPELINEIRTLCRERQHVVDHRVNLSNHIYSICCRIMADRVAGSALKEAVLEGKPHPNAVAFLQRFELFVEEYNKLTVWINKLEVGEVVGRKGRKLLRDEHNLSSLVKKLPKPVLAFVDKLPGFAYVSLAQLVMVAGDLSNYSGPQKLWKRLGIGLFVDEEGRLWRQRKFTDKKMAALAAYRPSVRALSKNWSIGIRKQKANATPLMSIYLEVLEQAKANFIAQGRGDKHADNHGLRVMIKAIMRDIWCIWNGRPLRPEIEAALNL